MGQAPLVGARRLSYPEELVDVNFVPGPRLWEAVVPCSWYSVGSSAPQRLCRIPRRDCTRRIIFAAGPCLEVRVRQRVSASPRLTVIGRAPVYLGLLGTK